MAKGNTLLLGGGAIWKMTKPSILIIMELRKSVSRFSLFSFCSLGIMADPVRRAGPFRVDKLDK